MGVVEAAGLISSYQIRVHIRILSVLHDYLNFLHLMHYSAATLVDQLVFDLQKKCPNRSPIQFGLVNGKDIDRGQSIHVQAANRS